MLHTFLILKLKKLLKEAAIFRSRELRIQEVAKEVRKRGMEFERDVDGGGGGESVWSEG